MAMWMSLVTVNVERELATLDLAGDLVEAGANGLRRRLRCRDHALMREHGGMGLVVTNCMSCFHMRLSNGSDAPNLSSSPVGAAEKRPPHRGLGSAAACDALVSLYSSNPISPKRRSGPTAPACAIGPPVNLLGPYGNRAG